jgi:hypothetical protein
MFAIWTVEMEINSYQTEHLNMRSLLYFHVPHQSY